MTRRATAESGIRLQKYLAACGVASRRHAEEMIKAGRVAVDDRVVTTLGVKVDPAACRISVDGRPLPAEPAGCLVIALHKPAGVITAARDPQGRTTVFELLRGLAASRGPRRVFHVGRLDYNSEGLLLLTNDGQLAQDLSHPSRRVRRTYRVKVSGLVSPAARRRMRRGVALEDGPAQVLSVELLKQNVNSCWLQVVLGEGRNRLVRRLFQALGHPVRRLIRTAYAGVTLGDLRPGQARVLSAAEVASLRELSSTRRGKK